MLARRAWENATLRCASITRQNTEGVLHDTIARFNFSQVYLGGRAADCTSHQLGHGGVWHASRNLSDVRKWLERAEARGEGRGAAVEM